MKALKLAIILIIFFAVFQIFTSEGLTNEDPSRLYGNVYEIVDGERVPIYFAKVLILDGETIIAKNFTGRNGSYEFKLNPGSYTINVERGGRIPQKAFVILESADVLEVNFFLELKVSPYEVLIIIDGLIDGLFPKIWVDENFQGYARNGTIFAFREGTSHIIALSEIEDDYIRYIPLDGGLHAFVDAETSVFQYIRQFYISSSTNPWIDGWYDEGSTIYLEARDTINYGNATRLVFDGWLQDETIFRRNPVSLDVNSSFSVDAKYNRQYLLKVLSERSTVTGDGWYDEGSTANFSVKETEVGTLPFKYRFSSWSGDTVDGNSTASILIDGPKSVYAEWEIVEPVEVEKLDPVYKAIINISLLIFAAKILGVVFAKIKLPEVLGELTAGILLGPYALGSLHFLGEPFIELNEYVLIFAEIGAILLLFIAGLEISFGKFKAVGPQSTIVGIFGVIVPFFLGLYIMQFLGFSWEVNLLVAAALTATSIAITMRTLEDMGKLNSVEGNIMINSAVIDDVLGLVVLAVVMSIVTSGVAPHPYDIAWILIRTIIFWLLLLAIMLKLAPRIVGVAERWKARGTVEVASTATCFGSAVAASMIGLSPIVGAFAAGMALASSRAIVRIRDYIDRLSMLFSPIFFAVIGAAFNVRTLSYEGVGLIFVLIGVAVVSKLVGCGIPAAITLKNSKRGFRVGVGMISRGEVGLIIAGIGVTSGVMNQSIYGAVVTMVILTTIVTPISLRWTYRKRSPN